ncbi:MAG TPA: iron chelate uptake ABC transporter family permease subunit [Steroidobacteraceae bacterium]|nr:iron chelate uptake ABC transporter family permease subunit [Steroidobacteraceae bacterium]
MIRPTQFWTLAALGALALMCLLASLLAGSAHLSLQQALAALAGAGDELSTTIVRTIRLPRTISAFAVGSLLGLAGVLLQALFRNPLADPFVLGVSGGASVGALAGMLAGFALGALEWTATGGALAIGALVYWMGSGGDSGRLLLSGVVLASACGAVISVLLAVADNGQLRGMVFWLAGDLGWAQHPWFDLAAAGVALLASLIGGRALNVLAAGELRSAVQSGDQARFAALMHAGREYTQGRQSLRQRRA